MRGTGKLSSNSNKLNCYVAQFPGLAQITSYRKKKELIDKEILNIHACVCQKVKKYKTSI